MVDNLIPTAIDLPQIPVRELFGLPISEVNSLRAAIASVHATIVVRPHRAFLLTFVNPLGVRLIREQPKYLSDLRRMDIVFSDGIAMTVAARLLARRTITRVSFDSTSIAPVVFEIGARYGIRIALVGGRAGVADLAAARIRKEYPGISILAVNDGYASLPQLVASTMKIDPPVVICGMGAPRQEAFLAALGDAGWCGCGITCGGYFDQLAERFHYYPAVFNRLNLRWAYRLLREPRRIGHRYFVEYRPFAKSCLQAAVRRGAQ